ncbi:hypothetical protein QKQ25_gp056 [Hyphantria cunea granulovirus]|uniref:Uncharacterized protein n=1 Tax=Hyphantria cunea granulovirus TaxID=307448 RepID=A0AAE6D0J7_9BBAC|nr:hypothetical protein QKQ25_gp056 [Hyphantria cunea granulovirus]QBQ01609.1 hypothetical protein HycuGV_00056 [Hyphantria cunea granulovirus]
MVIFLQFNSSAAMENTWADHLPFLCLNKLSRDILAVLCFRTVLLHFLRPKQY